MGSSPDETDRVLSVRIAGNTQLPCLLALRDKGYALTLSWHKLDDPEHPKYPFQADYEADKDGRVFSATSAEELLGLVAMWEARGDSWRRGDAEDERFVEDLMDSAETFDRDGNVIDDDD